MITIISATNRPLSYTSLVAERISQLIQEASEESVAIIGLDRLPMGAITDQMYKSPNIHPSLQALQEEVMMPSSKFWFVSPEYNGSYPGVLKVFIDACSIYDMKNTFHHKKACLTGVASGRAGNLRGMDDLVGVLHYLKVVVMPNKQPISSIHKQFEPDNAVFNADTDRALMVQVQEFLEF